MVGMELVVMTVEVLKSGGSEVGGASEGGGGSATNYFLT